VNEEAVPPVGAGVLALVMLISSMPTMRLHKPPKPIKIEGEPP
jgi:hypothetical protein